MTASQVPSRTRRQTPPLSATFAWDKDCGGSASASEGPSGRALCLILGLS
jgi:hypothetical protein